MLPRASWHATVTPFDPAMAEIDMNGVLSFAVKPMILVVDDHPGNVQILYEILQNDYDVCMATGGEAALAFCQRRLPDLILLDVVMPEMSGYELCDHLKRNELTQDIPVIFVTASNDPIEEVQGLDRGAVDFISKPVNAKVVLARVRTHLTITRQAKLLRSLAMIDGLTGIANRRQFDTVLVAEWRRGMRAKTALAVILIDIDFFKGYNDRYGHQAGDECIRMIAAALTGSLQRSHDLAARYGGEEFVCILPDTTFDGAQRKAAEIEAAVRALAIPHEASDVAPVVTISAGVAVTVPGKGQDPDGLIAAADRQLYDAKNAGRGQLRAQRI